MLTEDRFLQVYKRIERVKDRTDATQFMAEHWYAEDVPALLQAIADLSAIVTAVAHEDGVACFCTICRPPATNYTVTYHMGTGESKIAMTPIMPRQVCLKEMARAALSTDEYEAEDEDDGEDD